MLIDYLINVKAILAPQLIAKPTKATVNIKSTTFPIYFIYMLPNLKEDYTWKL